MAKETEGRGVHRKKKRLLGVGESYQREPKKNMPRTRERELGSATVLRGLKRFEKKAEVFPKN